MLMKCMRNLCFEPLKLDVEEELVLRERERERENHCVLCHEEETKTKNEKILNFERLKL